MTAPHILNPVALLEKGLSDASPDLMRTLLATVINALLSADADAVCGAEYGVASPERVNSRNGYRHRDLDTRVGTIDVAVPKLRSGSYFPDWLLEHKKRAESALISVVATCYLLGVSTRRMDKLVATLGITSLSKSQVSRMAADLDEQVKAFRTRRLDEAGPFVFVAADALTMKVRENGRVVNVVVLVATGVNADGHREVLGVQTATAETGAAWNTFFADLVARGLTSGPDEHLTWAEWATRLTRYYRTLERLFSPDLIVVGGGVSRRADDFLPLLDLDTPIVPAALRNRAGIVGAALYAVGTADAERSR